MLRISNNFGDVRQSMAKLSSDIEAEAMRLALNKTIDRGRTEMTRAITAEFAVLSRDVRGQLRVHKASKAAASRFVLKAELVAFGKKGGHSSRNVALFSARPSLGRGSKVVKFPTPQGWRTRTVPTGGGVSVKIKKGEARKVITGAFIGNQGRTVFIREQGARRLPIKAVETIDVPQMFNTKRINRKVIDRLEVIFATEFERALRLVTQRFGQR